MKARINGVEIEGEVSEIRELIFQYPKVEQAKEMKRPRTKPLSKWKDNKVKVRAAYKLTQQGLSNSHAIKEVWGYYSKKLSRKLYNYVYNNVKPAKKPAKVDGRKARFRFITQRATDLMQQGVERHAAYKKASGEYNLNKAYLTLKRGKVA